MNAPSQPGFVIRAGQPDDAGPIWTVHINSILRLCARHYSREQIKAWTGPKRPEDYSRAMAEGERFWVATESTQPGRIIGFACVKDDTLYGLYVDPAYVGRGIGTALLNAAEDGAKAAGKTTLKLGATSDAEPFYRSRGCVAQGLVTRSMGGVDVPALRMSKLL